MSSRFKCASATRARGVLMVKILNECILSLVYNLSLDRQRNILYTPQYFHTPVYCLHEIEILQKNSGCLRILLRVYLSLSSRLRDLRERAKGASEARARGILMVKTVNKYTLTSLVSDLFCDRQRM